MALRLRFFIRVSKKSDIAPIRARFSNGRVFDVSATTGEQIKPRLWNNAGNNGKGCPRDLAEFPEEKRKKIIKKLKKIEDHILESHENWSDKSNERVTSQWLATIIDQFYNPGKYIQKGSSLFNYIQHFIKNSAKRINPHTGNPVSYKMRREYQVTFNYLKNYAAKYEEPDFADIDMEFYNNFTELLRDAGLRTNTIGKKIQTLKIFLNAATEDGINQHKKYKSQSFRATTEETDNIYLNISELKRLYEYDLHSHPKLERVRDLFIIACWTGLRYSDLRQITKDRIEEGILNIKQTKTGASVWIPLHSYAVEILNKYNWVLPRPISNQKYNDYLKEVSKMAGLKDPVIRSTYIKGKKVEKNYKKHELVSSHTARRSFCTNSYDLDVPTITIMAISGHKTEAAFLKYIKMDGRKHAEKMRKIWQDKGFHMNVVK